MLWIPISYLLIQAAKSFVSQKLGLNQEKGS